MQTYPVPHRFPLLRRRPQGTFVLVLACVAAMAASPAMAALEEITEAELSGVTAQDGVKLAFTDTSTTVDYLRWNIDNGAGAAFPDYQSWLDLDDITWGGVNGNGSITGSAATAALAFDAGAPGLTDAAALALSLAWTRSRLQIDAFRHSQHAGKSFGRAAYDSSGSFAFHGGVGLFSSGSTRAGMRLIVTDGEWYYRQANNANTTGNEFLWDNLNVNIGFDGGTLGLTNAGLRVATPRLDFNMTWDIGFRGNIATASAFRSDTGYAPYLRYGWTGGLTDVEMILSGGGVRSGGGSGDRTEGVHFSFRGTPATDFAWLIGDPGGAPLLISFTDWVTMPSATYGINAPDITIDAIQTSAQGPGGFLYEGVNTDTLFAAATPDAGALAVVIRDLKFLSYNTKVLLHDTSAAVVDKTFNWGLVYTVGDLDLNLFVYPGGKGTLNEGIRFDLTLGIQSPGTWNQNSHYMLVDTDPDKNVGVGFVNTNFLITINNGYLSLLPTGMELETLTDFRWRLKSQFGGGFITDLSTPVRMVDIDMDLHASRINLLFKPPPTGTASGSEYIGYQWDAHFYQLDTTTTAGGDPTRAAVDSADTYIALSEPSRPLTQLKFGKISGDIGVRGGKISIKASNESADGYPRLSFEQNLQFGITAGLSSAEVFEPDPRPQPFIISDFSIGSNNIGAIAIPGGNWFARFELKEQI